MTTITICGAIVAATAFGRAKKESRGPRHSAPKAEAVTSYKPHVASRLSSHLRRSKPYAQTVGPFVFQVNYHGDPSHGHVNVALDSNKVAIRGPGLTREEVIAVSAGNLPSLRDCYRQALGRRPGLTGRIDMSFTVGDDGRVTRMGVARASLADPTLRSCVAQKIQGFVFPKNKRATTGVSVNARFTFATSKAATK